MFVLYIPVVNQHELTRECVGYLNETVEDKKDFMVLLIDNGSDVPYTLSEFEGLDIPITIINNTENLSGYYVILQAEKFLKDNYAINSQNLIGFMHNDVFVYERGWDIRVKSEFQKDLRLALVGFCGSDEVCDRGGRGGGTMCYFDGRKGQKQANTGKRVTDLKPALILDSLTMIFRANVIPFLKVDETICPAHFYDKIWSMRLADMGFHVGVMGIQIDHLGGMTSVLEAKYYEAAAKWCDKFGIGYDKTQPATAGQAVYLEAERRMFEEFAPRGLIPSRVDNGWFIFRMFGKAQYPAPSPWK